MIIKKFNLFESIESSLNFPSFEEIKSYFWDFTDETNLRITTYQYGYIYFDDSSSFWSRGVKKFRDSIRDLQDPSARIIDITNTDLRSSTLSLIWYKLLVSHRYFVSDEPKDDKFKLILSGKVPRYDYLQFLFESGSLFSGEYLENLIYCLKTIYRETGFRPIRPYWVEDYIDEDTDDIVKKFGYEGELVRVTDVEYKKLCQIFNQSYQHPEFMSHFN